MRFWSDKDKDSVPDKIEAPLKIVGLTAWTAVAVLVAFTAWDLRIAIHSWASASDKQYAFLDKWDKRLDEYDRQGKLVLKSAVDTGENVRQISGSVATIARGIEATSGHLNSETLPAFDAFARQSRETLLGVGEHSEQAIDAATGLLGAGTGTLQAGTALIETGQTLLIADNQDLKSKLDALQALALDAGRNLVILSEPGQYAQLVKDSDGLLVAATAATVALGGNLTESHKILEYAREQFVKPPPTYSANPFKSFWQHVGHYTVQYLGVTAKAVVLLLGLYH